ncbi:disease resistance protein RPP4-like isoform X2 [Eucalyptus grandis]|uniref:disease resistance protein RPP4-like isoform X2 n=1 Tax=Eucalyptus grandis TaxID=71139 RepID=UPI00192EE81B|nr:disease resistance protein RPP4-like isoform X2 [Eucalyptus grandis]
MDGDQSLILLSRHAFRRNSPPSEFKDLAHEVVSTTGGLPLSLEVLGSLLCGKRPTQWRGKSFARKTSRSLGTVAGYGNPRKSKKCWREIREQKDRGHLS